MAISATAAYKAAIRKSHKIAIRVDIYNGSTLVVRFQRSSTLVISGEVTVNFDQYIQRVGRVTIVDPNGDYIPTSSSSAVWYGRTMKIYRGVVFTDDTTEYVQIAELRVVSSKVSTNVRAKYLTLGGSDLANNVKRARFTDVYKIAAGTNVATAIRTMLQAAGITKFNFTTTTATTIALSFQRASDRWDAAQSIASAAGLQLYFDAQGYAVLRPTPDPTTTPISWTYDASIYDSGDDATGFPILDLERTNSDDGVYNHVIVSGESADAVVRAESSDTDPTSPTYINGTFGDTPYFETVSSTTSAADAKARADQILSEVLRASEQVAISTIPNPLMESGDVMYVKEDKSRTQGNYVVGGFTVPFERGTSMTITSVKQRVANA